MNMKIKNVNFSEELMSALVPYFFTKKGGRGRFFVSTAGKEEDGE